jgi:aldose 1-epimerase
MPIMRPAPDDLASPLDAASFPLLPFCNRIRDGRFTFRGRRISLAPNMPGDPSPLHGQGWLGSWTVEQAGPTGAELSFRHAPGEWPWDYEANQQFALDEDGLAIRLACRNLSDDPMPCGLGQHPYFLCTSHTRIDTRVTHVWTIDELVLPVDRIAATGRYDLADRLICGQGLDNGFDGWAGKAVIRSPEWPFAISIVSSDADCFQLYSPLSGGLFAAEPVTHANAALNRPEAEWAELGIRILAPGEEMVLKSRFALEWQA